MTRINGKTFLEYIAGETMLLDGASGTQMQRRGMPAGVCPEQWVSEHPEELIAMQREYIDAGSEAVMSFTFGGTAAKLSGYGITDVYGLNKRLAELSVKAAQGRAFVGGDMGPTGHLFEPMGDLTFDAAVEMYAEQARALADGGVDYIAIETMIDISEARAALIGAKEGSGLPVSVTMTFDENGRTLTGSSPEDAAAALIAAGADIIGINCSAGPDKIIKFIAQMQRLTDRPIIAKPNAGMPHVTDGKTVFDMSAGTFASYTLPLLQAGADILGGCCGTDPSYIAAVRAELAQHKHPTCTQSHVDYISCACRTLFLDASPVLISTDIGTDNADACTAMQDGEYDDLMDIALDAADCGAQAMCISADGMDGEERALTKAAEVTAARARMPVCFRSNSGDALLYALKRYAGRALIYPATDTDAGFLRILSEAERYGALAVYCAQRGDTSDALAVMKNAAVDIVRMTEEAERRGISRDAIAVDVPYGIDTGAFVRWCIDNGYRAAAYAKRLSQAELAVAIESGATLIFADTGDAEKIKTVRNYI